MKTFLTEFVGTFFLVLVIALTGNPFAIGAILMCMVYMGHTSGGHYNPAVTLALLTQDKINLSKTIEYIAAQCLAAISAAGIAFWLTGKMLLPMMGNGFSLMQGLTVEIIFTFALVTVILNTACTKKTTGNSYYGIAIGFTILAAAYAGGPISGGAFNPAVGIMPHLFGYLSTGVMASHIWIYIVGPLLGGFLASYIYGITSRE